MARSKETSMVDRITPGNLIEAGTATTPGEPDDWAVQRAIEEVSHDEEASVYVYRQGSNSRDLTLIREETPGDFRVPMLQSAPYNGGKFRVHIRRGDGKLVSNTYHQCEPLTKDAPAPTVAPSETGQIVQAIIHSSEQTASMLAKLGELIVASRNIAQPLAPQRGSKEILEELQILKTLMPEPAPRVEQPDPLDMLTKLLGVIQTMPGFAGGEAPPGPINAGPMDILYKLAEVVLPALAKQVQTGAIAMPPIDPSQQIPPRTLAAPPAPARAPAMPTNPYDAMNSPASAPPSAPVQPEPTDMMTAISLQLNFLAAQAAKMVDPIPYASVVVNNTPTETLQSFLSRSDWFDEICKHAPNARPYEVWFVDLRDEILALLTGDDQPADDAGQDGSPTPPA